VLTTARAPSDFDRQLAAAVAQHQVGKVSQAWTLYQRLQLKAPRDYRLLHLGGLCLYQIGNYEEAVKWLTRAVQLQPRAGGTHMCLGLALDRLGRSDTAREHLKSAVKLEPGNAEAWSNWAGFLFRCGEANAAVEGHRRAVQVNPGFVLGWCNLGRTLMQVGDVPGALEAHERALALAPGDHHARKGRAQAYNGAHRLEAALADFETVIAADSGDHEAASLRLYLRHFLDAVSPAELAREHAAFGERFAGVVERKFETKRDPKKRLRVAFLSPDLRGHSVAYFLNPLLAHLGKDAFEIILYHESSVEDEFSKTLRAHAVQWRNVHACSDAEFEARVLADAPDIVIELAGHTAFKRPLVLARRIAPVQGTYLGYPNTTGLRTIDFRLTDALADPLGQTDAWHTETLVRFSTCAWAYEPPVDAPPVVAPPCHRGAHEVVFGSFNNPMKLSPATLGLWASVLAAVPHAQLVIKGNIPEGDEFRAKLIRARLPMERCRLLPRTAGVSAHLASYAEIDIALDPLPYHGTTTTCEALWMGRPVITLAGESHVRRVGVSLLTAVGQIDCVAATETEYVAHAVRLASDPEALALRSAGLRAAMMRSPLLDHEGQALRFGQALRAQWEIYCYGQR
jgi:protein O-GlcNAc transferase